MGRSPDGGNSMIGDRYLHLNKIPIKNALPSPGLLTSDKLKINSIEKNIKKNISKSLKCRGSKPRRRQECNESKTFRNSEIQVSPKNSSTSNTHPRSCILQYLPGWHSNILQISSRVETRIARAFPVF